MNKSKYKVTKELCEAHLDSIESQIKVLQCDRALWLLYLYSLGHDKEVYVKGSKYAILDEGQPLPSDFLVGRFITQLELEEMRFEKETGMLFYDILLEELDNGSAVLYDDATKEFCVISNDRPMFAI